MADLSDLIKLADKGFTAEQITDMIEKAKDVELPEGDNTPPEEDNSHENDNTQELESLVKAQQTMIDSLSKQVSSLTTAIQANAIINSQQPTAEPTQTSDDILAALINPQD